METFCVNVNIHYTIPQELWVKVKENWRNLQNYITDFGYNDK